MPDYDIVSWALVTGAPSPATSGTSLGVTTGHGARFRTGAQYTRAVVYQLADPGVNEAIAITNRSSDTFTIVRNVDGRGAQTITSSGWALRIDHSLTVPDPPQGVFISQSNLSSAFPAYVPTAQKAGSVRANDAFKHRSFYVFTNNTGGAVNYTLVLYFGLNGVATNAFLTLVISVPANTQYMLEVESQIVFTSTATQVIISKVTTYNATTGAVVDVDFVVDTDTYDTVAGDFHIICFGQMASASASLTWAGYQWMTQLLRGGN